MPFFYLGRVHFVNVEVCKCEQECVTFLRHGLWPATTAKPRTAFSIGLLQLIEYLMLEGKASLLSICNSLRWKNDLAIAEVCVQPNLSFLIENMLVCKNMHTPVLLYICQRFIEVYAESWDLKKVLNMLKILSIYDNVLIMMNKLTFCLLGCFYVRCLFICPTHWKLCYVMHNVYIVFCFTKNKWPTITQRIPTNINFNQASI